MNRTSSSHATGSVRQVAVIDPARHTPELECFNRLALVSPLRTTYHLPGMFHLHSLQGLTPADLSGIVILGSAASVNERAPWQAAFEAWLWPFLEHGVPTLGVCYGHQMLAHMFGGRIEYAHPDKRKFKGLRRVEVDAGFGWTAGAGGLVVSHCEVVSAVPPPMRVTARSPEVPVEGLAHRTLPIWTFQAHPEAVPAFLLNHDLDVAPLPEALRFGHGLVDGFLAALENRS